MIDLAPYRLAMAIALASCAADATAERATDPLRPIVRCVERGSFKPLEGQTLRRPESATHRKVTTTDGERRVSTADGYRMNLVTSPGAAYVNLKIEQSAPGQFAEDRAAVLAAMQALSDRKSPDQKALENSVREGIEIFVLDQPKIDVPGPISFYTLLSAPAGLTATAYILNQERDFRAFKSLAEYEALRNRFLDETLSCLRQGASESGRR